MSEPKYQIKREGNHFKLKKAVPAESRVPIKPVSSKKVNRSIWSMIGPFFSLLFSGIVMIIGFLIATPFFILTVLINWVKLSIGFAIFWLIFYVVYDTVILNRSSLEIQPFNDTVILTIVILGLIASIFVTIAQIRE